MSGERAGELVRRLVGDLGRVAVDHGDDEVSSSRERLLSLADSLAPPGTSAEISRSVLVLMAKRVTVT